MGTPHDDVDVRRRTRVISVSKVCRLTKTLEVKLNKCSKDNTSERREDEGYYLYALGSGESKSRRSDSEWIPGNRRP